MLDVGNGFEWYRQRKALIMYHFHVEPKNRSEFIELWSMLEWVLYFEAKLKDTKVKHV